MVVPVSIEQAICDHFGIETPAFSPMSGGCINHGCRMNTSKGAFFLKWNDAKRYPSMFATESKGLKLLKSVDAIRIPEVELENSTGEYQYIIMEFIEAEHRVKNYWTLLGERLAVLHKQSSGRYGLDHDNYIGSLPQINTQSENWIQFFIEQRLSVQLEIASENSLADTSVRRSFERLYMKLSDLLPTEAPSLLHGDLWSGNLIVDDRGEPCLIDPAAYYGHREAELAFTRLFGGFSGEFYESYNVAFPLVPGFPERISIYNLYPLLVHLNLFGTGYLSDIKSILRKYD